MKHHIFSKPPALPKRAIDANKGSCGRVLVVGGSRGMAGAPCLTARAAYRSGAGLVRVAVPEPIWDIASVKLDECTTLGWPATKTGTFAKSFSKALLAEHTQHDVSALGMGLNSSEETAKAVRSVLGKIEKPLVLDADGLNAFKGAAFTVLCKAVSAQKRRVVLTPHPGEMSRLLGWTTAKIQAARINAVQLCAKQTGAVVVLKGHGTLVVDGLNPERVYLNKTGNPGMATGGTGDVLGGVIAALIAQGMEAFEATCLGVYLHGAAGDLATGALGEWSLIATDLLDTLPYAIQAHAAKRKPV